MLIQLIQLHLHPDSMKISDLPPRYDNNSNVSPPIEIPQLPRGVTISHVYADFFRYLLSSTRNFFETSTPNGSTIWNRLKSEIYFVFCTPNAWDISQQLFMRDAAILGGLLASEEEADLRLHFVTEGEASVHYALAYTNNQEWLQTDVMFAVVDAGGSTVDSTLYKCKETKPQLILEEVCASECVQVFLSFLSVGDPKFIVQVWRCIC